MPFAFRGFATRDCSAWGVECVSGRMRQKCGEDFQADAGRMCALRAGCGALSKRWEDL